VTYPSDPSNEPGSGYPGGYPSSYPSSYPASYPSSGYPAFPGGQDESRLRGRRPIQVGGIFLIVGVVLLIVGAFISDRTAQGKVNGFQRVAVQDHSGTINLKGSGGYIAYYESDSLNSDTKKIPLVGVTLTNAATGQKTTLDTTYGNKSGNKIKYLYYDHDGHKGLALWQFHIDQPGSYSVELLATTGTASDAEMAFGRSIATSQAVGAVIVVAGVLLLLAGLILLIVGLVKRRRHKRQLRSAPPGYGGYGGYGGAQPAGWPQPGGMQSWPPASGQPQQPPNDAPGWPPPPDQAGH